MSILQNSKPTTDEAIELHQKRVDACDVEAIRGLGIHYSEGNNGLPRDMNKAQWDSVIKKLVTILVLLTCMVKV